MKLFKMFLVVTLVLLLYSSIAVAGDFDWIKDFNITAKGTHQGSGQGFQPVFRLVMQKLML